MGEALITRRGGGVVATPTRKITFTNTYSSGSGTVYLHSATAATNNIVATIPANGSVTVEVDATASYRIQGRSKNTFTTTGCAKLAFGEESSSSNYRYILYIDQTVAGDGTVSGQWRA